MRGEGFKNRFRLYFDELRDPFFKCMHQGIVYEYSAAAFGVWMHSGRPHRVFDHFQALFASARLARCGDGEFIFIFRPASDKEAVKFLQALKTFKVKDYAPEKLAQMKKRGAALAAAHRPWEKRGKNADRQL